MQRDTVFVDSKTSLHVVHRFEHIRLAGKPIRVVASTINVQLNPVLLRLCSVRPQRFSIHPMNEIYLVHLIRTTMQDNMERPATALVGTHTGRKC